jgi:hypothetical protein
MWAGIFAHGLWTLYASCGGLVRCLAVSLISARQPAGLGPESC